MKPPPLSKSVTHRGLHHLPPTLSPTDKENLDLTTFTATSSAPTANTSQRLDGTLFDCYTFTEDDVHSKCPSSLGVGHKSIKRSVSSSAADQHLTHPTEPKSPNMCISKEPGAALSTHPPHTTTTTSARGGKQQNQSKKKPVKSAARSQKKGKFNSCLRNAVAAGASSATTMTTSSSEACVQGNCKRLLDAQTIDNQLVDTKSQGGLSDQEGFDKFVTDSIPQCSSDSSAAGHQRGSEGTVTRKQTHDIFTSLTMGSVYQESQTMGQQPPSRPYTQGNVESGGYEPDLDELSHGSHSAAAADQGSAADSTLIDGVPGNPKTDSIPTLTKASDSGSPSDSPASAYQREVIVEKEILAESTCNPSTGSGEQHGLRRSKRRQRGRREGGVREGTGGEGERDLNETWIQTSSQPLNCDHTGELESSPSDHISCSLPDRSQEERELKTSRGGTGTRAALRGRKRQRGGGGGKTTTSGGFTGRMTRSRAAALMKSGVEAENKEALPSSSDSRKDVHLPPTKKQKPRQDGPIFPAAQCNKTVTDASTGNTVDSTMSCDGHVTTETGTICNTAHGVTLNDGSASSAVTDCNVANCSNTSGSCEAVMETPLLQADSGAGGEMVMSDRPCKSSSPSPSFAHCSSSQTSQSQPHGPASMEMVCLQWFT